MSLLSKTMHLLLLWCIQVQSQYKQPSFIFACPTRHVLMPPLQLERIMNLPFTFCCCIKDISHAKRIYQLLMERRVSLFQEQDENL